MGKVVVVDGARPNFVAGTLRVVHDVAEPTDRQRGRRESENEENSWERHRFRRMRQCSSTPKATSTVAAASHTANETTNSIVVLSAASCRVVGHDFEAVASRSHDGPSSVRARLYRAILSTS